MSYNPWAVWNFHLSDADVEKLYQGCASLYAPHKIVPFVLQAARYPAMTDPPVMPPDRLTTTPERGSLQPPKDPVARKMWYSWGELYTVAEANALPKPARPSNRYRGGFVWDVWSAPTLEGAFRLYGPDGEVDPLYDLDRRPFADLEEALSVGDALAQILTEVK